MKKPQNSWVQRYLCAVNGVIGDRLEEKKSRLTIQMALTMGEEPPADSGKICILAHGSCSSERGWDFQDNSSTNYGSLLQADLGYAPFFLRYNSGLHISTNGKRLSDLLEKLIRCDPKKVREIVLIGHSMGGLVFRSACHYGKKGNKKWIRLVKKIFYLGVPHLGTHLEKLGKLATTVLNRIPNPVTKVIASLGDLRSAGIKDLRHGYLTDEDWQQQNADHLFYFHQNRTPLPKKVDHYLICGTLSKVADSRIGRLFGDGVVHPASGTGRGLFPSSGVPFLADHCKIFPGLAHPNLQRSMRVYKQIKAWCG